MTGIWHRHRANFTPHGCPRIQSMSQDAFRTGIERATSLSAGTPGDHHVFFVLGEVIGDCEPRRLGTNEDVLGRAGGRIVDEASHGDVDEGAVADYRIEERAAHLTARVVAVFVAKDHEVVLALRDVQLVPLDASERLEGRTSRPPAVRAVAVRGVDEFVRYRIVDCTA